MKTFLAALSLALLVLATPAHADECISDLNKALNYLGSAHVDAQTRREANAMIGRAQIYKMDGDFERCRTQTRQLLHILHLE